MTGINAAISKPSGAVELSAELNVFGQPLRIRAEVPDAPADLADVVPLARRVADAVSQRAIRNSEAAGCAVPCGRGCSACCRYLVPLSAPELLRLEKELGGLSRRQHRDALLRLGEARQRIIDADAPQPAGDCGDAASLDAVGRWYASLELDCAFLDAGACSIYAQRPISCRQHLTSSSPSLCSGHRPGEGQLLEAPVDVCQALATLAAEVTHSPLESVMLPLALDWLAADDQPARGRWNGPQLVERFLRILQRQAG